MGVILFIQTRRKKAEKKANIFIQDDSKAMSFLNMMDTVFRNGDAQAKESFLKANDIKIKEYSQHAFFRIEYRRIIKTYP